MIFWRFKFKLSQQKIFRTCRSLKIRARHAMSSLFKWIGAGTVDPAQPSPQLVRYACKRATRFYQLQLDNLDDCDYQWSM